MADKRSNWGSRPVTGLRMQGRRRRQAGFTLIEVMIASAVLFTGLLALSGLFITAIGNNGRSRVDSTSTMLAQSVIEQITAVLAKGGPPSMTDCATPNPNTFPIDYDLGGAALTGDGSGIDFTQGGPPAGYQMNFVVCNGGGIAGTQATYDVRWHVATAGVSTYLVTVSARPLAMPSSQFAFSLPVTVRAYVGAE